jgi:hypothetical protein
VNTGNVTFAKCEAIVSGKFTRDSMSKDSVIGVCENLPRESKTARTTKTAKELNRVIFFLTVK